ncbi:Predicted DNA-binding transcriptional regulator YafY, contains an HTH and WYL domains [Hymenobacter gelipurpurascens]|uniref:Predicted DNA-binding transcriptional regulator YafY, contains an HTH and WYL domains n=1 Tax=Hymenobacter gelipurpurascens TaxID=89968 RepID=A0A212UHH6_9BACT|nr:WYL domain-containing protein [Hymenobacter gelipurpurascens]SNC77621.1 Predicted DNA-binding transcriptional regulator YafY, contains an HTH and WYL domains [Hymenobacter gelipurpurascens]
MPVNKNAFARYGWIDDCLLRRQRPWPIEALMEFISERMADFGVGRENGISKRQVQEDIKQMRPGGMTGYEAPIEYDREAKGYYYSDPTYSIRNSPLVSDDAPVLRQALAMLQQFRGLGLSEELGDIVKRVEEHLQARPEVEPLRQLIWFEQVPDYAGAQFLGPLYQAVRARQVLSIRYRPFDAPEAYETFVHPYLLKQYNHRWFLIGQGSVRPGLSNFALDRIEALAPAPKVPYVQPPADIELRFADIVGVSVPANGSVMEQIVLRFRAGRGQYVRTKPLHPSQRLEAETTKTIEISLRVVPTQELETLLLSFGDDIEVLAPVSLRTRLFERLHSAIGQYKK